MAEGILSKGLNLEKEEKEEKYADIPLSHLFDNAFELYKNIDKFQGPGNSTKLQADIRRAMRMFEHATKVVSAVNMFSDNETFEEVPTDNIKYFLLPALLGKLTTKMCGTDDRLHLVKVAEIYFVDYIKRLKAYNLIHVREPEIISSDDEQEDAGDSQNKPKKKTTSSATLEDEMLRRNAILYRYNQEKDLESRLGDLEKNLNNPNVDDEIKRNYFVTLLKLHGIQIMQDFDLLRTEKRILKDKEKMASMRTLDSELQKSQKPKPKPAPKLQPIIITRDEIQKKVFGAGYPSLPVLTVEEFYEKRVKDGDWPDPSQRNTVNSKCLQDMANNASTSANDEDKEAVLKEDMEEKDDPEHLERARAMDEYKDTHRRGWGNRANRS